MKIAAIGDIHIRTDSKGMFKDLFTEISNRADILVLCGDLTDLGLPEEAEVLAHELTYCKIPVVGVFGNHDFENNRQDEIKKILSPESMTILGTEPFEIKGIGFAGVKGFGGGFEKHMLSSFGEKALKQFVLEGVNEALNLEKSLTRLNTKNKVVVLHYSPIKETVIGEPPEIYSFLGSSRLEETINRFDVSAVFHGHVNHGKPFGKTSKNIPVYNTTYPLLQKLKPKEPYVIVDV